MWAETRAPVTCSVSASSLTLGHSTARSAPASGMTKSAGKGAEFLFCFGVGETFKKKARVSIFAPVDPKVFLLLNLAFAFYNVGTIWAHEVDIFRSWKLIDPKNFLAVQTVH